MARLCVRIAPNDHPTNSALTPLRTRPGDVVEIVEDNHVFSAAERNCGQYRFIQITDATPAELSSLMDSVFDTNRQMIKRRVLGLDTTLLANVAWSGKTTATKAQIDLITVTRP